MKYFWCSLGLFTDISQSLCLSPFWGRLFVQSLLGSPCTLFSCLHCSKVSSPPNIQFNVLALSLSLWFLLKLFGTFTLYSFNISLMFLFLQVKHRFEHSLYHTMPGLGHIRILLKQLGAECSPRAVWGCSISQHEDSNVLNLMHGFSMGILI